MADAAADLPAPFGTGVAFVTGAGGFLGGAAATGLLRAGWTVAGFGHPPRNPDVGVELWEAGPVTRASLAAAALALGEPAVVFHAAGGGSVGASLADPEADAARTIGSLAETMAFIGDDAPHARLVYPSSAAVYGASQPGPIPEDAPLEPISPYGTHKREAEALIVEAARAFGLDAVILRFFSVYGPGLRKQLPWELAGRLWAEPARVELSGDGEEVRDFLHVDDAVRLVGLAAALPRTPSPRVINGGSGRPTTVRELAQGLRAALGSPSRIAFSGEARPGDPRSLLADPGRARALGFAPRIDLGQGLRGFAGWAAAAKARPRA